MKANKLSEDDIRAAYALYYEHTSTLPRPTLAALAHKYHVSTNTMFITLNRERERRQLLQQATTVS